MASIPRFASIALAALVSGPASAAAQVQTHPLPQPEEAAVRPDVAARQTGMASFGEQGGQQIVVRSFEPAPAPSDAYRIDFAALDADGDGTISREEAAAHPVLRDEFAAVDADGDGLLSREELRGWIR